MRPTSCAETTVHRPSPLFRRLNAIGACALFAAAFVPFDAEAITLYKMTAKDGRVTYGDRVTPGFGGDIVTLEFDAAAPTPDASRPTRSGAGSRTVTDTERILLRRPVDDTVEMHLAQLRLDQARKELVDAQDNSTPDDWIYYPGNPLGARRGPSLEYSIRLDDLDARVKVAEENLSQARRRVQIEK